MKNILLILISALLFSCGGDTKKSLVGNWDIFANGYDFEASITFYNDGSALLEESGDQDMGEWRIAGDGTLLCIGTRQDEICGAFQWLDDNSFRFENENNWFIIRRKMQSYIEFNSEPAAETESIEDSSKDYNYTPQRDDSYTPQSNYEYTPQSNYEYTPQ